MIVGTCIVELSLHGVSSLKEKRHILKSIIGRVQSRFNVSIAEVGLNDVWQRGQIGFSCVTTTTKHANQIINNVIKFIESDGRGEIINFDIEIF